MDIHGIDEEGDDSLAGRLAVVVEDSHQEEGDVVIRQNIGETIDVPEEGAPLEVGPRKEVGDGEVVAGEEGEGEERASPLGGVEPLVEEIQAGEIVVRLVADVKAAGKETQRIKKRKMTGGAMVLAILERATQSSSSIENLGFPLKLRMCTWILRKVKTVPFGFLFKEKSSPYLLMSCI